MKKDEIKESLRIRDSTLNENRDWESFFNGMSDDDQYSSIDQVRKQHLGGHLIYGADLEIEATHLMDLIDQTEAPITWREFSPEFMDAIVHVFEKMFGGANDEYTADDFMKDVSDAGDQIGGIYDPNA